MFRLKYFFNFISINFAGFDPFSAILHSDQLPVTVLLFLLVSAVTALCFYYKPCKPRPNSFGSRFQDRTIFPQEKNSQIQSLLHFQEYTIFWNFPKNYFPFLSQGIFLKDPVVSRKPSSEQHHLRPPSVQQSRCCSNNGSRNFF